MALNEAVAEPQGILRKSIPNRLRTSLTRHGVFGTAKLLVLNVYWIVRDLNPKRRAYNERARHFDASLGVQTDLIIQKESVRIDSSNAKYGTCHVPTPVGTLGGILSKLALPWENYLFIDLGSGLGRAVFMAAELPFSRLVGVEYSDDLWRMAVDNLRQYKNGAENNRIEFIRADAASYPFPSVPTVLYMYNPFGKEVMTVVLENLRRSLQANPRPFYVVLYYPAMKEVVAAVPELVEVETSAAWCVFARREQ